MSRKPTQSAVNDDRAWFQRHPGRKYRRRLPHPGEVAELGAPPSFAGSVVVCQIAPGMRARTAVPFYMLLPPSVVDGREITKPYIVRPPASEIFNATDEECAELIGSQLGLGR